MTHQKVRDDNNSRKYISCWLKNEIREYTGVTATVIKSFLEEKLDKRSAPLVSLCNIYNTSCFGASILREIN